MMGDVNELELENLEKEMNNVLMYDERYWQENDAKFRAVAQNSTYQQFEEIVKASHLKPLEKKDKCSNQKNGCSSKSSIWNSISLSGSKKAPGDALVLQTPTPNMNSSQDSHSSSTESQTSHVKQSSVRNIDDFHVVWRRLEVGERIDFVRQLGWQELSRIFLSEIPPELLGDMLQTFLAFRKRHIPCLEELRLVDFAEINTPTLSDIITVVRTLESISNAKRFSLSVQFLSSIDKTAGAQLVEKLLASLSDRQQDLAEQGVTEYSIHCLADRLNISTRITTNGPVCHS